MFKLKDALLGAVLACVMGASIAQARPAQPPRNTDAKLATDPFYYATQRDRVLAPIMPHHAADWRIGPVVYQVMVDQFAPSTDSRQW